MLRAFDVGCRKLGRDDPGELRNVQGCFVQVAVRDFSVNHGRDGGCNVRCFHGALFSDSVRVAVAAVFAASLIATTILPAISLARSAFLLAGERRGWLRIASLNSLI